MQFKDAIERPQFTPFSPFIRVSSDVRTKSMKNQKWLFVAFHRLQTMFAYSAFFPKDCCFFYYYVYRSKKGETKGMKRYKCRDMGGLEDIEVC